MFKRLSLTAQSNSLFRCSSCKQILFRQSDIQQYLSYDHHNLGNLEQFNNYPTCSFDQNSKTTVQKPRQDFQTSYNPIISNPKFRSLIQSYKQQSSNYFLLEQFLHLSTLLIPQTQQILISCHPFLKTFLTLILCSLCQLHLGYYINTVNINTIFLKKRIIINNNKNIMGKIVQVLESRVNGMDKDNEKDKDKDKKKDNKNKYDKNNNNIKNTNNMKHNNKNQQKQHQTINKLINIANNIILQQNHPQPQPIHKNLHILYQQTSQPNIFPSHYIIDTKQFLHNQHLSTLPFTNAMEKCSNTNMMNGNVNGNVNGNGNGNINVNNININNVNSMNSMNNMNVNQFDTIQEEEGYQIDNKQKYEKNNIINNNNNNNHINNNTNNTNLIKQLISPFSQFSPFQISEYNKPQLQFAQLSSCLQFLQESIISQCSLLPQNSFSPIIRIFQQLNKLDKLIKMIDNKIPEQLVRLENVMTIIRHRIIKPMQEVR